MGAVGLAVIMACKEVGASRIIGVDINSSKFEAGKALQKNKVFYVASYYLQIILIFNF